MTTRERTDYDYLTATGKMKYLPLTAEDVISLSPFYTLRPNRSCDSAPLDQYLYRNFYQVKYCQFEDALFLMFLSEGNEPDEADPDATSKNATSKNATSENGEKHGEDAQNLEQKNERMEIYGFLPYCKEEDLAHYLKLEETYFNQVLGIPLVMTSADQEGVACLKETDALTGYEVNEVEDIRDYLYDAESLRTLAGRKYTKKRNHINKFLKAYEGRWEYRTLTYADHEEVLAFLKKWMEAKLAVGEEGGVDENGEAFDPEEELRGEFLGIQDILSHENLFNHIRAGAIYLDGELKAFSMGDYNEKEKVAIISIEKADPEIPGLYQMINQQFARHAYPDALLINREDDVGIEGLRKSKMSYYPVDFEKKYVITQKNFPVKQTGCGADQTEKEKREDRFTEKSEKIEKSENSGESAGE
ncbi:DUF2156 domain-containing protein [Brotaphodocola sp.]|uniref:DUF2156 domain-containing protein n=1 Tax=Brotaphodocola sp. TaxID=3073577 RepID=UPI003D7C5640